MKLIVFEKAYELSLEIHRVSLGFPKIEQYALADQIRRASKSICANLAEGFGADQSPREKARFLRMAIGSKDEVKLWLRYARDLGYLDQAVFDRMHAGYEEVGKMLHSLKAKLATGN